MELRRSTGGGGRDRRRKTVSGYFQDWTTWMGSVENKNKPEFDRSVSALISPQIFYKIEIKIRSSSLNTDVTEIDEEEEEGGVGVSTTEEDLWSTWDKILVKWNSGAVTKCNTVKTLVRRGIPQHLRGITWQMLSGAHLCEEKSGYLEYLATDSACEKVRGERGLSTKYSSLTCYDFMNLHLNRGVKTHIHIPT